MFDASQWLYAFVTHDPSHTGTQHIAAFSGNDPDPEWQPL